MSAAPAAPRIVRCPCCGGPSVYASGNPFRPFCSERCKSRDLGAWASENYRVPAASQPGEGGDDGADDGTPTAH
jgi:endogenous inhibitor of DNA gyrase (YacG/DUF329 family)